MKAQHQLLKTIRLMTFMMILGLFTATAWAGPTHDKTHGSETGGAEAATVEIAENEAIRLEPWMVNESFWTIEGSRMRDGIPLEDWMIETPFRVEGNTTEEHMELESWMMNSACFRTEEQVEMETLKPWMLKEENFQTLEQKEMNAIQDWMVDSNFWTI